MRRWWTFMLLCLLQAFCNGQACDQSGWFGTSKCQFKCHCANDNQCDRATGECTGGCAKGWFGPQCQYVDLTSTHSTASILPWLSDGNDNTCNTDVNLRTVTVHLNDSLPFTWLRLRANNAGTLDLITLTFKDKTGGNTVKCSNMETRTGSDNLMDIHCNLSVKVQEVILTGDGVNSLCSVYISGGRNVALKQSALQSSTKGNYGAAKAIDGNTDGNLGHGSCTHTQMPDIDPYWTVKFPLLQNINRYVLYNRNDAVQGRLKKFSLTSFNESGNQVFYYQDPQTQPQSVYTVTTATSTSLIKQVTIKSTTVATSQDTTPVLTLCEVETYGDTICEDGKYGRECEHTCGNCVNNRCFVSTGGCPDGCLDRYIGYRCDEKCSDNCLNYVCDKSNKHCTKGCNDGFTGFTCEQPCSTNCKDNVCSQNDGTCSKGCIDGYTGLQCGTECGANCKDKICNQETGACSQGCNDGYTGSRCEKECLHPKYGPNCAKTCSINCTGQECDHVNGKCDLCLPGKKGDFCDQECPDPKYGQNCSKTCSKNCVDQVCNKANGTCDRCPAGWTGDQCDQVCPEKTYGEGCKNTCSIYCVNEVCNPVNGTCDQCVPGKLGNRCDEDCPARTYGLKCSQTCSNNCTDQLCDTVSGNCHECPRGKEGDKCERECETGKYGARCHQNCSFGCGRKDFSDTPHCDVENGTCLFGCFDGFTGLLA